jgi:hypothetical protein
LLPFLSRETETERDRERDRDRERQRERQRDRQAEKERHPHTAHKLSPFVRLGHSLTLTEERYYRQIDIRQTSDSRHRQPYL